MRSRAVPALVAIVLARGAMACVEGVTPDCSTPAVCSPIEGDAGPLIELDATTDAKTDAPNFVDARPSTSDAADAADGG